MKIAFITPDTIQNVQGATEAFYVHRHLAAHHTLLSVTGNRSRAKVTPSDHHFVVDPVPLVPYTLWYFMVTAWILFGNRNRFDLVYTYRDTLFLGMMFRLLNKKLVCDFRTEPVEQEIEFQTTSPSPNRRRLATLYVKRMLYKRCIRHCHALVTLSHEIETTLKIRYKSGDTPIFLQPLGVNLEVFKKRTPSPPIRDGLRLVNVTSIAPQREIELDLEALRILKERKVPALLTIVGNGVPGYIDQLKEQCRSNGISKRVVWKGYVPHHDIPEILSQHHVGLSSFPNLKAFRVASVSKVFEYLAMELVVVASDVLSNRKLIDHGANGLLFTAGSPRDLADQIQTLWEEETAYHQLRQQTRQSIQPYHWDTMLTRLMEKIKTACSL